MAMGLYSYGLRDTTATYATNFLNLIPITTFVFSIIAGYVHYILVLTASHRHDHDYFDPIYISN